MAASEDDFVPGQFTSSRFGPSPGSPSAAKPVPMDFAPSLEQQQRQARPRPTIEQLVATVRRVRDADLDFTKDNVAQENSIFTSGDWVEVRGLDMAWHLALLDHVEPRAFKRWDHNSAIDATEKKFFYFFRDDDANVVHGKLLHHTDLRAPEEGLKAVFGMRPWLWQQYALIRLESMLRFEVYHAADFEAVNIYGEVSKWFDEWLNDTRNGDFEEKNRNEEESTQWLLKQHLLSPFKLMERIRDDEDTFDFADPYLTVYSYLAVLGDGFVTVFLCSVTQLTLPILLAVNTFRRGTQNDEDPDNTGQFLQPFVLTDFPNNFCEHNLFTADLNLATNFDAERLIIEKLVLVLIFMIYVLKVIPDTFYSFYNVSGVSGTTYARINSLRERIYKERKDDTLQWFGYKLDRWMNTAYLNLLYLLMLFILYVSQNVLDIILNALAINFIHEIDENLANAGWWDPGFRWIKSGTMQLVFQINIDIHTLKKPRKFCEKYLIDYEWYKEKFKGTNIFVPSMKDFSQARADEMDPHYKEGRMGPTKIRDKDEILPHFGVMEQFFGLIGLYLEGQFNHYEQYRVWSRWNKVIYNTAIPQALTELGEQELKKEAKKSLADYKPFRKFIWYIITDVLTTKRLWQDVYNALTTGTRWTRIFVAIGRVIVGTIDWLTYAMPLFFPFAVAGFLILYFVCR